MDTFEESSIQSYLNDPDGVYLIIASFSMFLCDILESHSIDPITVSEKFNVLSLRYQEALHIDEKIIKDILADAQKDLENFQNLYNLPPFQTDFIDRLSCVNNGASYLSVPPSHRKPVSITDTFLVGLQEITEMLTSEHTTSLQLIHKIVRTVYEALHLRNCVLLMSSEKEGHFSAQDALGENAFEFRSEFKINLEGKDVFSACILRADDVLIQNLNEPKISHHLPPWYKSINSAGTAFLLPIKDHEKVIGVLYGDQKEIGSIHFTPDVSRNLKALRNQIRITRKLFPPLTHS